MHAFRNEPDARLICILYNGSPIKPEAFWLMTKQLKMRIRRLLENGYEQFVNSSFDELERLAWKEGGPQGTFVPYASKDNKGYHG